MLGRTRTAVPAAAARRPAPAARPTVEPLETRSHLSATLYTADAAGTLFKLNPDTGAKAVVGRMPVVMYDIAFDKAGGLWGVSGQSALYRVNPATAAVTRVGSVGSVVNALTFGPDGRLYAAGGNRLFTLNTATGRGAAFGTLAPAVRSAGDLAFDPRGNLFLTTTADKLVRINLAARTWTTVGAIGFRQVYGLAYMNGRLYGMSNATEQAFTINTTTGRGTLTANFGAQTFGANGAAVRV